MSRSPQATVLTTVFNGADHLGETIRSIQSQTFTDWEYIIVDDCSTDNTVEVIRQFAASDARIRLLQMPQNGGPFAAANLGLRHARGIYIVRTDADDLSLSERIERQVVFLRENPQFRACGSFREAFTTQGIVRGSLRAGPVRYRTIKWQLLLEGYLTHCSLCVERAALEEVGGYEEQPAAQDYRLMCELARREWLGVIPEILMRVRRHPASLSHYRREIQYQLGVEIRQEYFERLTGQRWSMDDVQPLLMFKYRKDTSLKDVMRAVRRWRGLWKNQPDLDAGDRHELLYWQTRFQMMALQSLYRQEPVSALIEVIQIMISGIHTWPALSDHAKSILAKRYSHK